MPSGAKRAVPQAARQLRHESGHAVVPEVGAQIPCKSPTMELRGLPPGLPRSRSGRALCGGTAIPMAVIHSDATLAV